MPGANEPSAKLAKAQKSAGRDGDQFPLSAFGAGVAFVIVPEQHRVSSLQTDLVIVVLMVASIS